MPITRPLRRTCRPFTCGGYGGGGKWAYICHPRYADSPEHYIRAFLLILKDLRELFDYVEPADGNKDCYSYRIHSLLLRTCVEVEANCKAIMKENGYLKSCHMNMSDYKKIEASHHLSAFQVKVPNWHGSQMIRTPFAAWASGSKLPWYEAYNSTKHDRHTAFPSANFSHLMDAASGLLILLSSQFWTHEFSPIDECMAISGPQDGMESGIGGCFRVKFPDDWEAEDRYDFNWESLKHDDDPFQSFDYTSVS